ncbi:MAG: hypothetical protein U0704_15320 [Candidatus Eisenbacteria bacterium]
MKHAVTCGLLAVLCTCPNAAHATGAYLGWDDCAGGGGSAIRTFACDTNAGSETIVGSFVPMPGISKFVAIEVRMEVAVEPTSSLPPWWSLYNTGTCRPHALSASCDFSGTTSTCSTPWSEVTAGGIAAWQNDWQGMPWRARLSLAFAMPNDSAHALDPGTEYLAYRVTLRHDATVGAGACAGCGQNACIVTTSARIYQPYEFDPSSHELVTNPVPVLSWQAEVPQCPAIVPVRNRTWGSLKTRYR